MGEISVFATFTVSYGKYACTPQSSADSCGPWLVHVQANNGGTIASTWFASGMYNR